MNDALQTEWIKWFLEGTIILLLTVVWWGVRAYRADMRTREADKEKAQAKQDARLEERDEKLQGCIAGLERSIWGLRDIFVLQKEYDRHLDIYHAGRRATDPILTDSGAKGREMLRALGRLEEEKRK